MSPLRLARPGARTAWLAWLVIAPAGAALAQPAGGGVLRSYELRLGNLETAVDRLERDYAEPVAVMRTHPLETRMVEARLQFELGHWEAASVLLFDLVENPTFRTRPEYQGTLLILGKTLLKLDNLQGAQAALHEAARGADPALADEARFHLVDMALTRGDTAELRSLLRSMAGAASPRTRYAMGKALVQLGDHERALAALGPLKDDPVLGRKASYYVGVALTALQQLPQATAVFEQLAGTPTASDEVGDLALLALGRLRMEAGDLVGSVTAYQLVDRRSPHYEVALYEMAWAYIKAEQYDRALDVLDALLLTVRDPLLDVEAHSLRGRLNIFLDDYDAASESFDEIVSRFAPIRNELDRFSRDPANVHRFFEWLLERRSGRVDLAAPLTDQTARWVSASGDMKRVVGVFDTLSAEQAEVRSARELAQDLERIVSSRNRVELFPELKEGWTRALVLENQLLALSTEILERQRAEAEAALPEAARAELAPLVAWRHQLEVRFKQLPVSYTGYQQRLANVDQRFLDLKRQSFLVGQRLQEVKRQLMAVEEYLDKRQYADEGKKYSENRERELRGSIEEEKAALEQLYDELHKLQRELEVESRRIGTGDEAMRSEADLKAALIAAHKREGLFYEQQGGVLGAGSGAYGNLREAIWRNVGRLGLVIEAIDGEVGRKASELMALIQHEAGEIAGYEAQMASYTAMGRSIGRERGEELFDAARERMKDVVLNAEVGLIDVAWQQKREKTEEISELSQERSGKLQRIEATLKELTSERIEAPGEAPKAEETTE